MRAALIALLFFSTVALAAPADQWEDPSSMQPRGWPDIPDFEMCSYNEAGSCAE
jgi:hypothetical protein